MILDKVLLSQYAEALGREGINHTVNLCVQVMPTYIDELEKLAAAQETFGVRSQAHKMKSACRSVGLPELAAQMEYLEKGEWQRQELDHLLVTFIADYEKAIPVLREWLADNT